MQKAKKINDVAIVSFKQNVYTIHFWYTRKDYAIYIMNNSDFGEKNGLLYFFSYV